MSRLTSFIILSAFPTLCFNSIVDRQPGALLHPEVRKEKQKLCFSCTSTDAYPSLTTAPPKSEERIITISLGRYLAFLYPTVTYFGSLMLFCVIVYIHNVIILALSYFCMKANLKALVACMFVWVQCVPHVIDAYFHTSICERQLMTYFTVIMHGFRLMKVILGLVPQQATESFYDFMTWGALPGEIKLTNEGRFVRGDRVTLLRRFVPKMLAHIPALYLIVYSQMLAKKYLPFPSSPLDPRHFPFAFLDLWTLYVGAAWNMFTSCVISAAFGYECELPYDLPWFSSSFREMWGKRWNRFVQINLQEIFFNPLKNRGYPGLGGFLVFLYSALFHEYMWWFSFRSMYIFGENIAFFMLMYAICSIEVLLHKKIKLIPRWLGNLLVAIFTTYFSRLFTNSIQKSNATLEGLSYFPQLVMHEGPVSNSTYIELPFSQEL